MKFVSTRGQKGIPFVEMLQTGYALDGGILLPERIPQFSLEQVKAWSQLPFGEICFQIMREFCPNTSYDQGGIPHDVLRELVVHAHDDFDVPEVIRLVELEERITVAELFHGPTYAFKDLAMQVMGRLLEYCVEHSPKKKARCIISTTGDTGPAALAALSGRKNIDVFVLYPLFPSVSRVQEMQMIGVRQKGAHILGTRATADTNDDAMRRVFADSSFRSEECLTTINSINFGRVLLATAHYFFCCSRLLTKPTSCDVEITFSVPSGSFGNGTAYLLARLMGLPSVGCIVANNANDVTNRLLRTGVYRPEEPKTTCSPAIDCQTPYNLERVIFLALDSSSPDVVRDRNHALEALKSHGEFKLCDESRSALAKFFVGSDMCTNDQTMATMRDTLPYVCDPHTAVALFAARRHPITRPNHQIIVCLATAHPRKFPDLVAQATHNVPPWPRHLKFMEQIDFDHLDYGDWNVHIVEGSSCDHVEQALRQQIQSL